MEILRPAAFLLLLLLPLFWWWHRRSLSALGPVRRFAALSARMLIFLLVVFALSEPRRIGQTDEGQVFLLVDRSASVGDAAMEKAKEFLEQADFAGAETDWLAFAGLGRIRAQLADLEEVDPERLEPSQTWIDSAISLAVANFRPGRVRTMVLFSDGVTTGGEVDVFRLAEQDIRVHVVPVSPPDNPEVLVREVRAPALVRTGEPVEVVATIQSTREGPAEVGLFRNGVRIATQTASLQIGANEITFEDRADEDRLIYYEVAVRAEQDTLAENNRAGAAVLSEGASKVLLLTDRPESARYLEWALRQEGIDLGVRPAEGVPTDMSDLQNFDAVIIDNIPASDMSRVQMDLLHAYVRDFGGGLLMLGGDQAYGLGGYFRTPVEDLLPVQCDFQKEEESPSMALALVIDRSGSMSGDPMELAKTAARASLDLLSSKDYISVIAFDSQAHPVVPLQSAANAASIATEIASITAGGGTSIAPGMEEALRQLSGSPAKIKHVIVMTDGFSTPGPFYELATQMVQNGITVSSVAVGQADTELLARIAEWGNGRYYETNDFNNVPQIFTKETMTASKSAIQEFPFRPRAVRAVDFLEGVAWADAPFLLGYVRTKAKPTSETWLVTERGDPLLITWRFGLGTSAAFTSDARNRWAVEWLRWNGFGKFWAQLLRRISRPPGMGLAEITLSPEEKTMRITVDALDPERGFPGEASGNIRLADPEGNLATYPLEQVMPGRWEAEVPANLPGVYSGQVFLERNEQPFDTRFFTFSRGFSPEFLLRPPDETFLRSLASETGGEFEPDPARVFQQRDRQASSEQELWPWLALLALLLFPFDVAIRRWPDSAQPSK